MTKEKSGKMTPLKKLMKELISIKNKREMKKEF